MRSSARLFVRSRAAIATCASVACAAVSIAGLAFGQRIESNRPRTLVVGAPRGAAAMERVDPARSGLSSAPLPSGKLRIAWQRNSGFTVDHAPIVGPSGDVILLTNRGDVITFDAEGNERTHVVVGSAAISGGALLADGTLVFLDGANEAVGVQLGGVRFRTHLGGDRTGAAGAKLSPLPLDDGGFVIAGISELTTLDAEGNVRARTPLREPLAGPLLAALGKVVAVAATGTVYTWSPASTAHEPVRIGTLGGSVDGGAALSGDHTLVAIVDGTQLVALDLLHGITVSRASASASGTSFFLGPPALRGDTATFLALTPTRTFLLTVDAAGQETRRQSVASSSLPTLQDGGSPSLAIPPHIAPIVDAHDTVAFAAPDAFGGGGAIGIATAGGTLDLIGDSLCARASSSNGTSSARPGGLFAGLVPGSASAFVLACENGVVAKISSE